MAEAEGRVNWGLLFPLGLFAAALTPILRTLRKSLSWDEQQVAQPTTHTGLLEACEPVSHGAEGSI